MYIPGTILSYPRAVALPAAPFGVRIVDWDEFAADNPDIADDVALQIAIHGRAHVGGGAAPLIKIGRG